MVHQTIKTKYQNSVPIPHVLVIVWKLKYFFSLTRIFAKLEQSKFELMRLYCISHLSILIQIISAYKFSLKLFCFVYFFIIFLNQKWIQIFLKKSHLQLGALQFGNDYNLLHLTVRSNDYIKQFQKIKHVCLVATLYISSFFPFIILLLSSHHLINKLNGILKTLTINLKKNSLSLECWNKKKFVFK